MSSDIPPLSPDPDNRPPPPDPPPVDDPRLRGREPGARAQGDPPADVPAAPRPQADFGPPIDIIGDISGHRGGDAPEATVTDSEVPPMFAEVDAAAEPRLATPPRERPLSVRISQGMPSYFEPEPEIAGVVGGSARGAETPEDPAKA